MTQERKPCVTAGCENTVGEHMASGMCFTCSAVLKAEREELFDELDTVLRLEAEFQQWCIENGHPDPHV